MKISKNLLFLLCSYLGATLLISSITRWLPSGGGAAVEDAAGMTRGEVAVVAPVTEADESREEGGASEDAESFEDGDGLETSEGSGTAGEETSDAASAAPTYTLCAVTTEEGMEKVGVYGADGALLTVTDVPLLSLPTDERARIEAGLILYGDDALRDYLQDLDA